VLLCIGLAALSPSSRAQLIPQLAINGTHTIRVSKGQQVDLNEAITGNANGILTIEGWGRVTLNKQSNAYRGAIIIRGAEFWNPPKGLINQPKSITISNGGSLIWDNTGAGEVDHIQNHAGVILAGGTLQMWGRTGVNNIPSGEDFGPLAIASGANTITIKNQRVDTHTNLRILGGFYRNGTATLNLTGNALYSADRNFSNTISFNYPVRSGSFAINQIVPWATVEGDAWVTPVKNGGGYFFTPFTNYYKGEQSTWGSTHNISLTDKQTSLTAARVINSLHFPKNGTAHELNLGGKTLTIESGGLLSTGDKDRITGAGKIQTSGPKTPLYIHVYGKQLRLEGKVALNTGNTASADLVKTGPGELVLDSDTTHKAGTVAVHQGVLRIVKGWLSVLGKIVLGDGAGIDALQLAANRTNPLVKTGGGALHLTLNGNPFGDTREEAILRFGGGTRQQLATLHIEERGTLDFLGGSAANPNILYLDKLSFSDAKAELVIRNWDYAADYLLVKRTWGNENVPALLSRIHFVGYGPALWTHHSLKDFGDYWQISPIIPEPATYGAILGGLALTLFASRKRNRANGRWLR